jgi:hypothetical protein
MAETRQSRRLWATWRRSDTSVLSPALARYAAQTSPLWPPPTMIASYACAMRSSRAQAARIGLDDHYAGRLKLGNIPGWQRARAAHVGRTMSRRPNRPV